MAGMNETPSGERIHIGFFGRRNAGKSSVVNAVTGQDLAVVSEVKGTTTDPVTKSMEILPLGPVVIIDTPGFDDEGSLGELRIQRTRKILEKTDIAVLVVDTTEGFRKVDAELVGLFKEKSIPFLIALNKSDIPEDSEDHNIDEESAGLMQSIAGSCSGMIHVSAITGDGINELKDRIALLKPQSEEGRLVADKINPGDLIVLVVPIDKAAPKGRLILPQQQTIRDILDTGATAVVVQDTELADTLDKIGTKPALVITDSQVFDKVDRIVPPDVPLTSFSILMEIPPCAIAMLSTETSPPMTMVPVRSLTTTFAMLSGMIGSSSIPATKLTRLLRKCGGMLISTRPGLAAVATPA